MKNLNQTTDKQSRGVATKNLLAKLVLFFCLLTLNLSPVYAQADNSTPPDRFTRTILPEIDKTNISSNSSCLLLVKTFENIYFFTPAEIEKQFTADLGSIKRFFEALTILQATPAPAIFNMDFKKVTQNDILGCAIVTGRIKSFYLSIFLSYALNMLAILAGSISMLFIMIGGYRYVLGSLTQNTDGAKKTIINALIGLAVSTGAWIIVNIVQTVISS